MVRGVYISRAGAERLTVKDALQRYLVEVTPIKKPTTQRSEKITAEHLIGFLDKYSMVALSGDLAALYRDHCVSTGRSNNTARIELAMLSKTYFAVEEAGWGYREARHKKSPIRINVWKAIRFAQQTSGSTVRQKYLPAV